VAAKEINIVAMQEEFDPYRKWLGIPAAELPPSHYRLLGLVDFESDPDVIGNAADRCMAHVRTFQSGARAELSQRILNELAQAGNCLLDPQRRQAYDLALRQQRMATTPTAVRVATPVNPMAPVSIASPLGLPQAAPAMPYHAAPGMGSPMRAVPVASSTTPSTTGVLDGPELPSTRRSSSVTYRVRRKSSPVPMLLAMVAVVVALGIGLILWLNQRNAAASLKKKPAPPARVIEPKTYVIKRQRVIDNTPDEDRNESQAGSNRSAGGAPVVDIQSSTGLYESDERNNPTSAAEAIEFARSSMARGNPFQASRMLEAATELSPNDEQKQRIAILTQLQEYLNAFHIALAAGAEKLEPGRNFLIDLGTSQVAVTFVEFERQNGRRLVFESEGKRMTYGIDSLPADWAMPIARSMLDSKSPAARLAIATFLALAANGDRELARQMWESLISEGIADASLARELNLPLSDSITKTSTAPAEMKPEVAKETMPAKAAANNDLLPIPSGEALTEAKRKFRDDYREQVSKARSVSDKEALAGELVAKAAATTDNADYRYVLQLEAIDLLVGQGSATELVGLIDKLGAEYEVDVLSMKAEALGKASAKAASAEEGEQLYLVTAEAFSTAKELKRYDVAERLARVAAKCAERAQVREAAQFALVQANRMQSLHQMVTAAIEGREKLKSDANDGEALSAVGRWECFLNNNWELGLPLLKKGSDAPLAELAKADLAAPQESAAQAELGERWLQYGQSQREGLKPGPIARAKHWYEQALTGATETTKAALEKSLDEIEKLLESEG
jgi:hypothetical protein